MYICDPFLGRLPRKVIKIGVERSGEYLISFVGLKDGDHSFQFHFDDMFFETFENSLIISCQIVGQVILTKKPMLLELLFSHKGIVNDFCDRCGQDLKLDVEGEESLIFKYSHEAESASDEIKFIAPNEDQIDVAPYFYELISLNLPSKRVHNVGECDDEVISVLEKINIKVSEETDPRWDALKKLKKDKK